MLALSLLFITIPLLFRDTFAIAENVQWRRRDFYGVVKVVDDTDSNTRYLVHGQIQHGAQKITGEISLDDTLYYGSDSGVCRAWSQLRLALDRPLHVGIVGLGTGALSLRAYEGDIVTFYELSQAVEQAARARFKFIASSSGQIDVVLGDGRVLLEREVNQNLNPLDLLVIDAFSNDAVPSHLLTREAFKLYRSRIQEKGIIAFHTTHRLLNIGDVVVANSNDAHLASKVMHSNIRSPQPSQKRSNGQQRLVEWVLVSQTQDILEFISDDDPSVIELHRVSKRLLPWTDDCINIFQIMK